MITKTLPGWLDYIASVHPREIELGLERVRTVATRMKITRPAPLVVTVGGTNGKGSCVASLETLLEHAGYRSATYTSPHIHKFNERIRVGAANVADAGICDAFAHIEACRGDVSLSYFEFATLAALWIFQQSKVDVAVLEVGLGGRLDAVNIIDADVMIIASISLDHQDWLGNDVETIGAEKAGIMRAQRPVVYASTTPPNSIVERARQLAAPLLILDQQFGYAHGDQGNTWTWFGRDRTGCPVTWDNLPLPWLALSNVAAALQVLQLLRLDIAVETLRPAIGQLRLAGRCERRVDRASGKPVLLDVAHNPAGAMMLAANLAQIVARAPSPPRVIAVVAVMADKDIEGMVRALESCVHIWYIAQVDESRCLAADAALQRLQITGLPLNMTGFDSVQEAYIAACERASAQDLILVTGSFHTVAAVRDMTLSDINSSDHIAEAPEL